MTRATGDSGAAGRFADDWQALRADGELQFAPLARPPAPEPPDWWLAVIEFFGDVLAPMGNLLAALARLVGMSAQVLTWLLVLLAVVVAVLAAWRYWPRRAREAAEAEQAWTPDAGEALALLEDADRLAAGGRFDEAARLLLRRSVGQIAAARPGLLEPSSTAREIAVLPALPDPARQAFAAISALVERSLFALRGLTAEDWRTARAAYADFALAAPRA